ncbi:MAG: conjugal transfer protein TraN [Succinivibrionaceae bacterium]
MAINNFLARQVSARMRNGVILMLIMAQIFHIPGTVAAVTGDSHSQVMYQSSAEGRKLGNELQSDFMDNAQVGGGSVNYRGTSTGEDELKKSAEIPGAMPEGFAGEAEMRDADSPEALTELSTKGAELLYQDMTGNHPSYTGQSYKILLDTRKNRPVNDLRSDKRLRAAAEQVYHDLENDPGLFADCSEHLQEVETAGKIHVSDYQTCNRLVNRSAECEIEHTVEAEPVIALLQSGNVAYDNSLNIRPCDNDENCFILFLGQKYADNGGECLKYLDDLKIAVYHPEAITKVAVTRLGWDDFFGSWITGSDLITHPLVLPTRELPVKITSVLETDNPEAQAAVLEKGWAVIDLLDQERLAEDISCENTWHGGKSGENCSGGGRCNLLWDVHLEKTADGSSLTRIFRQTPSGGTVSIRTVTSTADDGQYLLQLKIYYDPAQTVYQDLYTPENCLETARSLDEKMARGDYYCVEDLAGVTDEPYLYSHGLKILLSDLQKPLSKVPATCGRIAVSAVTDYAVAPEDDNPGDIDYDQCHYYEENCGFISSRCIEEGDSGNCYAYEEIYDCGTDLESREKALRKSWKCGSEFFCTGDECVENIYQPSESFARVSALLEAARLMGSDMSCTGLDENGVPSGEEDVVCQVFAGEHKSCTQAMKGMGGLEVDCCSSPSGVSLSSYICALRNAWRLDGTIAAMDHSSLIYGVYSELRRPLFNAVSELSNQLNTLTKPFVSWFENTTGMQGLFSSQESITDYVINKLKEKLKDLVQEVFGAARDNFARQAAAEGAVSSETGDYMSSQATDALLENLGSLMSAVGYVYMVYQISCMVSQMVFSCKKDSLELAARRALKNCTYVGQYCSSRVMKHCVEKTYSYCCFSSPLSRILQEQIRKSQGIPFAFQDPAHPDCSGISTSQLDRIKWEEIDLSEWTDLLKITGNYAGEQELDPEFLTGSESVLSLDYSDSEIGDEQRADVTDRTLKRVKELDLTGIRNNASRNVRVTMPGE